MKRINWIFPVTTLILGSYAVAVKAENPEVNAHASVSAESKIEKKDDGTYSADTSVTKQDKDGTVSTDRETTTSGKTMLGNDKVTTTKKSTVNPPGLMNEQRTDSTAETVTDSAGNVNRNVDVKSVDAEGTAKHLSRQVRTQMNPDGTKQTTTRTKSVTDPKGLMNKKVEESQRTVNEPN